MIGNSTIAGFGAEILELDIYAHQTKCKTIAMQKNAILNLHRENVLDKLFFL